MNKKYALKRTKHLSLLIALVLLIFVSTMLIFSHLLKEVNEYYFTKKVFKAIESFSNKMNLKYKILIDNKTWIID